MSDLGRKDDTGKAPWYLLPWGAVEEALTVLGYGARKYGPDNWRHVPNGEDRYFSALIRHLVAWREGEWLDPESELPHLAHVVCNALFLLTLARRP